MEVCDLFASSPALLLPLYPAELKGGIAVFEQQVAEMEAMHREDLQRREELSSQLTLVHREKAHVLEQVCVLGGEVLTHVVLRSLTWPDPILLFPAMV